MTSAKPRRWSCATVIRSREADVLVLESTYGDRNHRSMEDTETELVDVMHDVLHDTPGNVIVPAFALGRTQELLVLLYRLAKAGSRARAAGVRRLAAGGAGK